MNNDHIVWKLSVITGMFVVCSQWPFAKMVLTSLLAHWRASLDLHTAPVLVSHMWLECTTVEKEIPFSMDTHHQNVIENKCMEVILTRRFLKLFRLRALVSSAAVIALGISCLLANTRITASLNSSSFSCEEKLSI